MTSAQGGTRCVATSGSNADPIGLAEGTAIFSRTRGQVFVRRRSSFLHWPCTWDIVPTRANRESNPKANARSPKDSSRSADFSNQRFTAPPRMGEGGAWDVQYSGSPFNNGIDHFFGLQLQRHAHSYFPNLPLQRFRADGDSGKNQRWQKRSMLRSLIQNKDVLKWVDDDTPREIRFFCFYAITAAHGI